MQDVEGVVSELQVLVVIDGRDGGLALANVVVVVDVVGKATGLLKIRHRLLHQLIEDVVGPLHVLLEGDARLLQQVGLDVAAGQLASGVEVDADELALKVFSNGLKSFTKYLKYLTEILKTIGK